MLAVQILINSSVIMVQVLLLAAALYLIYTVSGVVCIHLGSVLVASAYTYYALVIMAGLPAALGCLGALFMGVTLSLASYGLLRPLISKKLDLLALLLCIAMMLGLEALIGLIFGASPRFLIEGAIPTIDIGPYSLNLVGVWTLIIGFIVTVTALGVIYGTSAGRKLRAVNQHEYAAQSLRLNVTRVQVWTYVIAGGVVAVMGILTCMNDAVTPQFGNSQILPAFIALIVGGVRSFKGTVLTAMLMILGIEFLTGMSFGSFSFSPSWNNALIFGFALIALLIKPEGLFSFKQRSS